MTTEVFGNFKNHDCDNCGTCKYSKKRGNKKPCKTCFGNSAYEPNDICCLTCKHGMMMNPSGAVCNIATSCHNYNRWEPVEVKKECETCKYHNSRGHFCIFGLAKGDGSCACFEKWEPKAHPKKKKEVQMDFKGEYHWEPQPDWEAEYANMKQQRDNTNSYHTRCHQEYKAQIKELTKERDALNIRNITLREVIDELEKERDELQQSLGMTDRLRKLHLKESKEIKEERMHIMGLYNNAKSERDSLKHQLYTVTKERDELQEIVDKADYYVPKMKKKVECSWRTFKYSKEVIKE